MFYRLIHRFFRFGCNSSYGRLKAVVGSTTTSSSQLQHPSSLFIRFVSSTIVSNSSQLFTLDYLINSCGLSPESALKASQSLLLTSPKTKAKPDSVVSLFKIYGFTHPQISKMISSYPLLLLTDPEKNLKPKLEFFSKIGNVAELVCSDQSILRRSLDKEIIPSINFLRSLSLTDASIVIILRRSSWVLHNAQDRLGPKIAVLQELGAPQSNILKCIVMTPRCFYIDHDRFKAAVSQLNEIGVDPSSAVFWRILHVCVCNKKSQWDAKMAVYRSFGWSEDEVLSMFRKQPNIMSYSKEKINSALDFVMNSIKWNRDDFAKYPIVVGLSMEKRVSPRCYVIQILVSNGLIDKPNIGTTLIISHKKFVKNYVIKYQEELPGLMSSFNSKISGREIKIGSEDDCKIDTV